MEDVTVFKRSQRQIVEVRKHDGLDAMIQQLKEDNDKGIVTDVHIVYSKLEGGTENSPFSVFWFGESIRILGILARCKIQINKWIDDEVDN